MLSYGYYYAGGLLAGAAVATYLLGWPYALPFYMLAAFCLYFFRDPERAIPAGPVAVSPADGKVVAIRPVASGATRISIFLNIFDVHVNRTPIAGKVACVNYKKGQFLAANRRGQRANEHNILTVEGDSAATPRHVQADRRTDRAPDHLLQKAGRHSGAGRARRPDQVRLARRRFFGTRVGDRGAAGERVSGGFSVLARIVRSRRQLRQERMKRLRLQERFIDPRSPDRRPRRAAYALPTLFTAGNVFLGFFAIMEAFQRRHPERASDRAGCARPVVIFAAAAIAIGVAVLLDGLDGRIARMTNTVSDFGREMDSLADVISFGIAPAVLAYRLGRRSSPVPRPLRSPSSTCIAPDISSRFCFCCAARRAWRASTSRPIRCPKIPAAPDRKYFVGLPIPAAAAMVASVVYAFATASRWNGGSFPWCGWRCSGCFRS